MSSSEQGAEVMRCPECGGECVATVTGVDIILVRKGGRNPFTARTSRTRAQTCTSCGYTRLYAEHPEKLR